jgi:hypothetical protein
LNHRSHADPRALGPSRAGCAPIPGCTSVASSIHVKTCGDVLQHAGPGGVKALLLLNPDLDCALSIEPNTPVCIAAQGARHSGAHGPGDGRGRIQTRCLREPDVRLPRGGVLAWAAGPGMPFDTRAGRRRGAQRPARSLQPIANSAGAAHAGPRAAVEPAGPQHAAAQQEGP